MAGQTTSTLIFVRESEGQLTGSGCCGKLEGGWRNGKGRPVFVLQRKTLQAIFPLSQAARRHFGRRVEVLHVDPRNQLFLFPRLLMEGIRHRAFGLRFLCALLMIYRLPAVIFNGELLFSGRVPSESEFLTALENRLGRQTVR